MASATLDEKAIFNVARQIDSPDARLEYLRHACGADADLVGRVETLLRAYEEQASFLESPPARSASPTIDQPPLEKTGAKIGPYKLLQQIGEGGFGIVYMAEQLEPVRRKVALKLIKPGMDTRQVIARFEAERQALAVMDHPNIARVIDAGASESGRPYFVMDLVRGTPITTYCDENSFNVRERLALFASVCQAIQHAHQKGIIHRDLKPTNILVAEYDNEPVPKVIDFGVAKATSQALTEKTMFTGFGQIVGTLEYMSPEQAKLNQLDIDTRSDIYSLGVLLYELLTGSTPFDRSRLCTVAFDETLRIIREEEPPKPSTRLSSSDTLAKIAAVRGTEPARLTKLVRGELDWIVMKALEKDRNRRYESANALAADVQRSLHDEPVQACPPSAWYRFRKFARRNKRVAVMASFVLALMVVAVAVLGMSYAQVHEALRDKTQALEREQQTLYFQRIAMAEHARANDQNGRAEELLELCPPGLRGWEWHYLKRLPFADFPVIHPPGALTKAAFSPDGGLLAWGGIDGIVKIWDAQTGAELHEFPRNGRFVKGLAFSPDGRLLAVGCEDEAGMVKIWDVNTGQLLRDLPGHAGAVIGLAFSPDGSTLASACLDDNVRLWDVATGRQLRCFPEKVVARDGLAFRPDGRLLTASMEGTVKVHDVPTGQTVSSFRGNIQWVFPAAFSCDGRLVALGSEDGTVKVWETESGKEIHTLKAHGGEVVCLAFLADDRRLASCGDDRALKIWDLSTGQEALQLGVFSSRVQALAVSADGLRLAWSTAGSTAGRIFKVSDGTPLARRGPNGQTLVLGGHFDNVVGVAFSPDGRRLASVSWDKSGKVWDAATGQEQLTLRGHEASLTNVTFSLDGRLIATSSWDETVKVWDASTGQELFALRGKAGPVFGVAFSPDGSLASAHHDGTVKLWQAATGQRIRTIQAQSHPVVGVAFSPDGQLLACAGGKSNTISVWKVATGERLHLLRPEKERIVWAVAFSPDGRLLATAEGSDGAVDLWDVATGETQGTTLPHSMRVLHLAFSPDGRQLATVSLDQAVRLWDVATQQELAAIRGHVGDVWCTAFSPDGGRLATGAGYKGKGEIRIREATLWQSKP